MADLSGMRIAILATDGVELIELTKPRDALKEAGARIDMIGLSADPIQGFNHFDKGETIEVDYAVSDVNPDEYDAAMLPGGALNADIMRMDEDLRQFLRRMDEAGKPIAFICHAPWEMVSAGLVKGRELTGYYTVQDDIVNAGGTYHDREVVEDRNWVSSRGPDDIEAFNGAMLRLFESYNQENRGEQRTGYPRRGASHPGVSP